MESKVDSLNSIANSERQIQFLKILSNSQHFVIWLQKETNGKILTCSMTVFI